MKKKFMKVTIIFLIGIFSIGCTAEEDPAYIDVFVNVPTRHNLNSSTTVNIRVYNTEKSTEPAKNLKLYINGSLVRSWSEIRISSSVSYSWSVSGLDLGYYQIKLTGDNLNFDHKKTIELDRW